MKNFVEILKWILPLLFCSALHSQTLLKGKVVDAKTKESLPFAIIQLSGTTNGTSADIDGNFSLEVNELQKSITVSLVGYEKETLLISDVKNVSSIVIKLNPKNINLMEVEVKASENPANKLINEVIKRKPLFDISNLKNYICETYSKTYFTTCNKEGDEITSPKDTFLNKQYLFLMEDVTEKKYQYKNNTQEKVIASRTSGLKKHSFGNFASQLQSFTFYDDKIKVLDIQYINPLTGGTHQRYWFTIKDTLIQHADTTIIIRFAPKKTLKVNGLEGLLYINKAEFVLTNVIAKPFNAGETDSEIKIQQLYNKVDSIHWFPSQLNTELIFKNVKLGDGDKFLKAHSKQYVKKVNIDSVFKLKQKWISSYNAKDELNKSDEFWAASRIDSISEKEKNTYRVIDSIGKEAKLDSKIKWLNILTKGKINLGYFDYELKYIFNINQYEGVRLGSGFSTSDKLCRFFNIGAYGAYGFKDKQFKYGTFANIYFNNFKNYYIKAELHRDVRETAGFEVLNDKNGLINISTNRDFLIKEMDRFGMARLSFNMERGFMNLNAFASTQQINSRFGYADYLNYTLQNTINTFNLNEVGLQLKFWPKQKFVQSFNSFIPIGSKWPQIYLSYIRGLNTEIAGYKSSFEYDKINLKVFHRINFKVKGSLTYQVMAGMVNGNVPYSIQYNNFGSNTDTYYLSVAQSFETMYLNEFVSNRFAALFLNFNTGPLFRKNDFLNPNLDLVHNVGVGQASNTDNITNLAIQSIEKGYSEAGIRLNSLYTMGQAAFGVGVFYRYGNYQFENQARNFAYKLSVNFKL
ncbi:MAG: carboxypeptidase-like regulatory domain-containing protein [Bacteroidetes bacterium]|nr:carboxypeptidase-like regulatory domain-containing protein [Bacteroidota bacterium]MCA6443700.1 carboxypeptidase-like regulatory domain-containing protein [Bacteroidota bacterium]